MLLLQLRDAGAIAARCGDWVTVERPLPQHSRQRAYIVRFVLDNDLRAKLLCPGLEHIHGGERGGLIGVEAGHAAQLAAFGAVIDIAG